MSKLKVMFLCTGNSCRSQMAEGWARALKGDVIEAYSAGVSPHGMNARAVAVMKEAGVDITGQWSKHVDEIRAVKFDYVVTVCGHADETCPPWLREGRVIHHGFDDPPALARALGEQASEDQILAPYRRVRDEIRAWVETLTDGLESGDSGRVHEHAQGKPVVLILCTGNSCRSQMAEGFLRSFQGDRYEVASAGTNPKDAVHPLAVRVMSEAGVDVSSHRPRALESFLGKVAVRHLLIVCDRAQQSCPRIWPGAFTRDYMPFDDPADADGTEAQKLDVFRRVRDEIADAMRKWKPGQQP